MHGVVTTRTVAVKAGTTRMAEHLGRRCGELFVDAARGRASRRTGRLAESIRAHPPVVQPTRVTVQVTCDVEYGVYQDQGTGIYGPLGRPIRPKKPGGVLVFDWPAAGGVVFAREVRGSEPTRFWERTVRDWPLIVSRAQAGG